MKGWLVINSYLNSLKFTEIYDYLVRSSLKYGIKLDIYRTSDILTSLDGDFSELPDFVLYWDKDTYICDMLEQRGVPVFNSAEAIRLCDNKKLTGISLQKYGVAQPKTVLVPLTFEGIGYTDMSFLDKAADLLGFPMIIKEAYGSFGKQVHLVHDMTEAKSVIGRCGFREILLQEYIASSCGRDVRVNVVGNRVIACMLRYNEADFRSNISNGGSMKKASINKDWEAAAIKACKAVKCDFAGVDVLFGKDAEPIVCEVNSNPHFKSTFECTGIDLSESIMEYIKDKL